ncbi:MAG: nickel pincer cofactor biosynthesis protein LarC [Candidatus Zipacnadales bacterium]
MKVLHLDCFAGIAGDMLLGALVDLGLNVDQLTEALSSLPIQGWQLRAETVQRKGIQATKISVSAYENAAIPRHLTYEELTTTISAGGLSPLATERALAVLCALAQAEATVHGVEISEVHFHEVGGLDTLIDVVGSVVGLELLGIAKVTCSALPLSHGFIECAHGTLPIPPPAVMELVKGVPTIPLDVEGETVTPTGAALAVTLARTFGPPPPMTIEAVGYGAGTNEWPTVPNILRLFLGETTDEEAAEAREVVLLEANIDDMPAEHFTLAVERCLQGGALDVWLTPIQMKKNRPAVTLSALAEPSDALHVAGLIFANTTTLGIRWANLSRLCLPRRHETVQTPYGPIRLKIASRPDGAQTVAPEYEDCLEAAQKHDIAVRDIFIAALTAHANRHA